MPKIAEIERTPNPNAMKFVLKEPLTYGASRSYDTKDQAGDDALARALFEIPHVTNVFYVDQWLTVTQDGGAEWNELLKQLAIPIREAPAAEAQSQSYAAFGGGHPALDDETLSDDQRHKLSLITDLIDERVRPYLQGDGGDLYVVQLEDNLLKVHYQGACGSCPSSLSATLTGIEGLVQSVAPELQVVPV
jgi:NFU1 iron-sulfur cluster scaffold homolog, mitochondrial